MNSPGRALWQGYVGISLFWMAVLSGVLLFTHRTANQTIEILPPPTSAHTAHPCHYPHYPLRVTLADAVAIRAYTSAPRAHRAGPIATRGSGGGR